MTEGRGCFDWMEIGRAMPDGGTTWTVWMALLPEGAALYRTLVVADDALLAIVEFQQHHGAGMRTLHKGRRHLPPEIDGDVLAKDLLASADDAAYATLARSNGMGSTCPGVAVPAEAAGGGRRFGPLLRGV